MVATAKKKKAASAEPFSEIVDSRIDTIKIKDVTANTAQSRGMGVLSNLQEMEYGLFERISTDKDSIWNMLWSDQEETVAHALNLIEENEASIVNLAGSTKAMQLQSPGVFETEDGEFDCIYGMRRIIAAAYNHLKHQVSDEIEVKVYGFNNPPTKAQLLLMALKENNDRLSESPIDLAMSYKRLHDEQGLSPLEIGEQIGKSDQYVRNYIKLLDPKIKDLKGKIHTGKTSVDTALKILAERKQGGSGDKATAGERGSGDKNAERFRLPGPKGLQKILDAKKKPKKVSEELWEYYKMDLVREFLCTALGLKFEAYTEPPPEEKKKKKGDEEDSNTLKVKKKQAVALLVALGETNAATYDSEVLANKLENVVSLVDENEEPDLEDEALEELFEKLKEGYNSDQKVIILKDKKVKK